MSQYCNYCGTHLNGEALCPKCQRATGEKKSDANAKGGDSTTGGQKRKASPAKVICTVIAVFAGYALILGICAGIHHARIYFREAPQRTIEKIKHLPDDVVRIMADEEPIYATEYGWRLLRGVGDGYEDVIPIDIFQKRMDKAGEVLLGACERLKRDNANSDFRSHAYLNLMHWRDYVLRHSETSRRYWQDEDFRRRVDAFFGGSTFDLE